MKPRQVTSSRNLAQPGPAAYRSGKLGSVQVMGAGRWRPAVNRKQPPRIIAVGAGTSGVGKSMVASNLAIAMAELGSHVILVDLDLEAPRLHTLFGIERPTLGLQALLENRIADLDGALCGTGIRNLHLVTGEDRRATDSPDAALARTEAAPLARDRKRFLLRQIRELDSEVIVVDVGAGNQDDLLDFFSVGALRVVVATPSLEGLGSAYGFLKQASLRAVQHFGGDAATPGGMADEQALDSFCGKLVGNQAMDLDEAERFHAFSRLVWDHLRIPLPVLGCLHLSERIREATSRGRPFLLGAGSDENVRAFHRMAEALMQEDISRSTACDLAGATAISAAETAKTTLPADLADYMRRHPRYEVDWAAILKTNDRIIPVRVVDISVVGAAIAAAPALAVGTRATLVLEQLPLQPALPVQVANVQPALRRVGLSFLVDGDVPEWLVANAMAERTAKMQSGDRG